MAQTDILMPALSPTMESGRLARWLVKVGDRITPGDVIAEIETDKASMEVEAVEAGVLLDILVGEGAEAVAVNTPIARLAGESDALAPAAIPAPTCQPAAAPQRLTASPPTIAAPVSPLARRLAEQLGLELVGRTGSGPGGRIVKADIAAVLPHVRAAAPAARPPAVAPQVATLEQQGIAVDSYELVPLDAMRRVVARRMTESFRDTPHFSLTVDLEIDALLAVRAELNALLASRGLKASINDMILKAVAVTLARHPEVNASYTPEGIAMHRHSDIAMAVAVPGGLIAPIVRRAERKGVGEIAAETRGLAERARSGRLAPEEYQGGTVTVSNLGMYGVKCMASILNAPHACILGAGAGERRAVVHGERIEIATVMTVTLTCDHRVIDGAVGAAFLETFKALIEDPILLLA